MPGTSEFHARLPHAAAGQRIGLLGGSFNPAHDGHLQISHIARRRLRLDQVWWIVSPGNPLKDREDLAPLAERMAAARRRARSPHIVVTDLEASLGSVYTADTLTFLTRRARGVHFVWLMGADNLVQLPRWRRWRAIPATMPIAVIDRPGWHLKATASIAARTLTRARLDQSLASTLATSKPPRWVYLTGPLSSLSSTAIREARRSGQP